ncbi:hypothetical protein JXQ31_04845 [candidate division KSB1 bacterium]|nr:hypothetical protein [candidate division KSB1 bacterium]
MYNDNPCFLTLNLTAMTCKVKEFCEINWRRVVPPSRETGARDVSRHNPAREKYLADTVDDAEQKNAASVISIAERKLYSLKTPRGVSPKEI